MIWTKGPSPAPEEQPHTITPPPPSFTLGPMQSDEYRSPGNRQTQTPPSGCQMEKRDSSSGGVLYTTASDALRCTWWCVAWMQLPWKPIPRSSLRTVPELIWRPHEGWRSVATDSAESRRPLTPLWHLTLLPVEFLSFHFVTIPLTAECYNPLSSWERPILSQTFVEAVCIPRGLNLYTCGRGSDWNTWI